MDSTEAREYSCRFDTSKEPVSALRCLQAEETKPGRGKKHRANTQANPSSLSHYRALPWKRRIRSQMGLGSTIHMLSLKSLTENSLNCVCGINQMSGKHYRFVMCISSVAIANNELFHHKLWCYEFNTPSCEKNHLGLNASGMTWKKYLSRFKLCGTNKEYIYYCAKNQ